MHKEEIRSALGSLDDTTFQRIADAAVASRRYKAEVLALNAAHMLVLLAAVAYLAYYIPAARPPVSHRFFLAAMVVGALPLALIKLREITFASLFSRALARQAIASGVVS